MYFVVLLLNMYDFSKARINSPTISYWRKSRLQLYKHALTRSLPCQSSDSIPTYPNISRTNNGVSNCVSSAHLTIVFVRTFLNFSRRNVISLVHFQFLTGDFAEFYLREVF